VGIYFLKKKISFFEIIFISMHKVPGLYPQAAPQNLWVS